MPYDPRIHALCENCEQPVHTDGDNKRGWIHTQSGNYSCGGEGFAAPADPVDNEMTRRPVIGTKSQEET